MRITGFNFEIRVILGQGQRVTLTFDTHFHILFNACTNFEIQNIKFPFLYIEISKGFYHI